MNSIKKNSLSTNMIYQFIYQIVIFVLPLIMAPYLTRKLQENALGIHSYINSIAYYFVIIANLGIVKYGQRLISSNSDEENCLRKSFWSLFAVHVVFSIISLMLYFLYVTCIARENQTLFYIEGIYVLSALFDITWLYFGLENFKIVVKRNLVIKILECICVFTFVNKPEDLWAYTLITATSFLTGQIIVLPHAMKAIRPIKVNIQECSIHIKPLFVLSISVIAITLYTVFDKTLLGVLSTKDNVAFYEYSNRIINIPRTLIGVIGTIMYPRACRLAAKGDFEGQKEYMQYSILLTMIIGIGSVFGLFSIAHPFSILYYGESFSICGNVIIALSPLIIIVGLGDVIRTQYMIPNKMDVIYTICIILNAVINIVLTVVFIPILGIYGAVIGTVSAELFGLLFQGYICRLIINLKSFIFMALYFSLNGLVMFGIVYLIGMIPIDEVILIILKIAIGAIVYGIGTMLYLYRYQKTLFQLIMRKSVSRFVR